MHAALMGRQQVFFTCMYIHEHSHVFLHGHKRICLCARIHERSAHKLLLSHRSWQPWNGGGQDSPSVVKVLAANQGVPTRRNFCEVPL